jgi:uncharacterized protein (TIGR02145 family)
MKTNFIIAVAAVLMIVNNTIAQETGTFIDTRDGKVYKTIKIGKQTWMAENFAYKTDKECWAYNNDTNNVKIYGYLYSLETATNICPAGWHVPASWEWDLLIKNLGGPEVAGGKLKEAGNSHWIEPNKGATNESGFTALPAGYVVYGNKFYGEGDEAAWWSKTEFNNYNVVTINLVNFSEGSEGNTDPKSMGRSVRYVKD